MTVKLTWTPRVIGTEQRLYRSTTGLDPADMPPPYDFLDADVDSYEDVSALPDTRYFYVIGTVAGSPEKEVFSHFVSVFTGDIAASGPAPVVPIVDYELAGGRADVDGFVFDAKNGIYKTAGAAQTIHTFFSSVIKPAKGTHVNSGGTLTNETVANTAHLSYNPTTLVPDGIRVEQAKQNAVDGDVSSWAAQNVLLTQNGPTGPYAGGQMWRVTATGGNAFDQTYYDRFCYPNSKGFFAAWVAEGTATHSQLRVNNQTVPELIANINFQWIGGVPVIYFASAKVTGSFVEDWGGGLYRVGMTFDTGTLGGSGTRTARFMFWPDLNATNKYGFFGWPLATTSSGGDFESVPNYHYEGLLTTQPGDEYNKTLGGWWNVTEGTIFARARTRSLVPGGANNHVLNLFNTANERISILIGTPDQPAALVSSVAGGVTTNLTAGPTGRADEMINIALRYKANNFGISAAGSAVVLDNSIAVPSGLTVCRFGRYDAPTVNSLLNGFIQQAAYWPYPASDEELINLSTYGI